MKNLENLLLWFVFILVVIIGILAKQTHADMGVFYGIFIPIVILRTYKSYLQIKNK